MRIKFLSIIASFFMVSFLITSCLDDDNDIDYSPDATIHAFGLDTIGYGVYYKFTIDQITGLIYNEDSLPVNADTIIDRILIDTLTTASGVVTISNKEGKDSTIINISDSIDLTPYINPATTDKYLKLTVWAPDMQNKKVYSLGIRVHKHDPDSLLWQYKKSIQIPKNAEQKSVLLNSQINTYVVENGILRVYMISTTDGSSSSAVVNGNGFNNQLPHSILAYNNVLYATSSNKNGKVYQSTNGVNWAESTTLFNGEVDMLLASLKNKITYIQKIAGKKYFSSTAEIPTRAGAEIELQEVPDDFPTKNISFTTYWTSTNLPAVMLVGGYEAGKQPTVAFSETQTTVPWVYMGNEWIPFPPNNVATSCPAFDNPTVVYYNNLLYIYGNGFKSFYTSTPAGGIAWYKANKKFSFPYYTKWGEASSYSPEGTPEFRGRDKYSTVLDPKTAYIWVIFSGGTSTFKESIELPDETRATSEIDRTYTYGSEVWRGRLNQLWFDIANNKYTY